MIIKDEEGFWALVKSGNPAQAYILSRDNNPEMNKKVKRILEIEKLNEIYKSAGYIPVEKDPEICSELRELNKELFNYFEENLT